MIKDKTDNELLEMVYEFNSWNDEMLTAVEKELSNRNMLSTNLHEKKQILSAEEDIELTNRRI